MRAGVAILVDQLGHGQLVRKLEHDFVSGAHSGRWRRVEAVAQTMTIRPVSRRRCHWRRSTRPVVLPYSTVDWSERRGIDDGHEGQATHRGDSTPNVTKCRMYGYLLGVSRKSRFTPCFLRVLV